MPAMRLQRGLFARLRTLRVHEAFAWLLIAVAVPGLRHGFDWDHHGDQLLAGLIGAVWRLAIATESVRCDDEGIWWRTLFLPHHVPWSDVRSIGIAPKYFRVGRGHIAQPCVEIERISAPPISITPAVWCPMVRQAEFIAAARLMSPIDWTLLDERSSADPTPSRWSAAVSAGRRARSSGKRVGHPIPRRREGPNA